jgi:hypothetical protein
VRFEHLARAAEHTARRVAAATTALADEELSRDMSIVVFGSWARDELTEGSDDDWAVLVAREFNACEPAVVQAMTLAQKHLGAGTGKPGAQDVFGVPFDVGGLVQHTGLDADTNRNLTRRMLLLLESRELRGTSHAACWGDVLDRYLRFGVKNHRPPRFTWLTAPPSDRLAAAFLQYGAIEEGVRTFKAYDRWIAIMQDSGAREELRVLRATTRDKSDLWQDIRAIGDGLQRGMTALLFDTALRPLAPQYAIF